MQEESFSLKSYLKNSIRFYKQLPLFFIKSILKYWFLPLAALLLIVAFYFYATSKATNYYKAESLYTFNYLNKKFYAELLEPVAALVAEDNTSEVAKVLKLDGKIAGNITQLEALNIKRAPLVDDYSKEPIPFYISVKMESMHHALEIQNALTFFINNNPFVIEKIKKEKATVREKKSVAEAVIADLEAAKGQEMLQHIDMDGAQYLEMLRRIEDKKNYVVQLNEKLAKTTAVVPISRFQSIMVDEVGAQRWKSLKLGIVLLLASFVACFLLHWLSNEDAD